VRIPGVVVHGGNHYHLVTVDVLDKLSPTYWWTDPGTTIEGPVVIGFAAVLGIVLVVSVAVWILAPRLAAEERPKRRAIARIAKWSLGFAVAGLLLLLFRWQLVPFLSKRLWFVLWGAGVVAGIAYTAYYWRRIYPERLLAWQEAERRRRYLPKRGEGSGRARRRSRRRR
jgi:hypothetical protein